MDSRRRSPPLMPPATSLPMRLSATLSRPMAAMTSSARFSFCATGILRSRRSSAVVTIVSRTVSVSRHTVVCATKPEARLKDGASIGAPFTSTAPPLGCRRPASSFISDVLPAGGGMPARTRRMRGGWRQWPGAQGTWALVLCCARA